MNNQESNRFWAYIRDSGNGFHKGSAAKKVKNWDE